MTAHQRSRLLLLKFFAGWHGSPLSEIVDNALELKGELFMDTGASSASRQALIPLPGEKLTRQAVTVVTAAIMVMTFAFSLGNVARLCSGLGNSGWMAWLVGPAVDLSVIGLVIGVRFLSLHGYTDEQLRKPRGWLLFCGFLTLALTEVFSATFS
jgi:hypothetical protein